MAYAGKCLGTGIHTKTSEQGFVYHMHDVSYGVSLAAAWMGSCFFLLKSLEKIKKFKNCEDM